MTSLRGLLNPKIRENKLPLDEDEIQDRPSISNQSKKITKFKRENFKEAKIISLGLPRRVDNIREQSSKKYCVEVKFQDKEGRMRCKNIRFGNVARKDFIDHLDESKRLKTVEKIKEKENWLHPDFYHAYLLNSAPKIEDAFFNLNKVLIG